MRAGLFFALAACSGGVPPRPAKPPATEETFGPLEVGADYATYRKVSDAPFLSLDHGNRWVEVFVNELGARAYLDGTDIPVGTVVVKTSRVTVDKQATDVAGPMFVMEKRAPGYAPDHEDWWYAIYWPDPPAADAKRFGSIYWRGKSKRVAYCVDCHDNYVRGLGGLVPSSLLPR
jgi:hypothetical protein